MSNVQFPYPRKTSQPANLKPARSTTTFRPRNLKHIAILLGSGTAFILLLIWLFRGSSPSPVTLAPGTPRAIIVTTLDPGMSDSFKENIMANRRDYAARHGYDTFFPNTTDYNLMPGVPSSWSMVPAMRHAMAVFPSTPWIFYLTRHAMIMDPHQPLFEKVLEPRKLETLMIGDKPVVPPDSVIKTFAHLKGERINVILSQDQHGLAAGSLLVRSGDWAKYFLDAWFDPLYRSYNFQKAEKHALEHLVQWHGTTLAKLALVPQRVINSYVSDSGGNTEGIYQEGDFVANFESCTQDQRRNCEEEMKPLVDRWRELRDAEKSKET